MQYSISYIYDSILFLSYGLHFSIKIIDFKTNVFVTNIPIICVNIIKNSKFVKDFTYSETTDCNMFKMLILIKNNPLD